MGGSGQIAGALVVGGSFELKLLILPRILPRVAQTQEFWGQRHFFEDSRAQELSLSLSKSIWWLSTLYFGFEIPVFGFSALVGGAYRNGIFHPECCPLKRTR